jgi:cytidylate kinase
LSFTGTTTLASELARALGWNFVSAGQRFRQFCDDARVSLTSIPNEVHSAFDATIQEEIRLVTHVVIEGRYLGFFAKRYDDVLTVWIQSNMSIRRERCLAREGAITSAEEAQNHILHRDDYEKNIGIKLYDLDDFTDPSQFDYVFENNTEQDRKSILNRLLNILVTTE